MSTKFADAMLLFETRQQAMATAASLLRAEDAFSKTALPSIVKGLEGTLTDPQTDAATQAAAFDVLLQLTTKGACTMLTKTGLDQEPCQSLRYQHLHRCLQRVMGLDSKAARLSSSAVLLWKITAAKARWNVAPLLNQMVCCTTAHDMFGGTGGGVLAAASSQVIMNALDTAARSAISGTGSDELQYCTPACSAQSGCKHADPLLAALAEGSTAHAATFQAPDSAHAERCPAWQGCCVRPHRLPPIKLVTCET